jgi:hypothetical protein
MILEKTDGNRRGYSKSTGRLAKGSFAKEWNCSALRLSQTNRRNSPCDFFGLKVFSHFNPTAFAEAAEPSELPLGKLARAKFD